jgi:hypothetical protein
MNMLKKALGATAAAALVGFAAPASAVIVGGIDFGILGSSPINTHLETATLAQTFVNGANQAAMAYGMVTSVNGDTTYCADGTANCSLYYVTNTTTRTFSPSYVSLGGTTMDVYYSPVAGINLLTQNSTLNLAAIMGLTKWATFTGALGVDTTDPGADQNAVGLLTGATLTATGSGILNVNTTDAFGDAAVEAYFNTGSIPTIGHPNADLAFTTSANNAVLNAFDVADGLANTCQSANQTVGQWCYQGTANFRGTTPEPGSLALLGLGLAGMAFMRRKGRAS